MISELKVNKKEAQYKPFHSSLIVLKQKFKYMFISKTQLLVSNNKYLFCMWFYTCRNKVSSAFMSSSMVRIVRERDAISLPVCPVFSLIIRLFCLSSSLSAFILVASSLYNIL